MQFDYSALQKVIRQLREERNISQEVFSGLAGISRSHLSMIEIGSKKPNLDTLHKIAQALDMSVSDLLRMQEAEAEKDASSGADD